MAEKIITLIKLTILAFVINALAITAIILIGFLVY